jgi:hypothetical protein
MTTPTPTPIGTGRNGFNPLMISGGGASPPPGIVVHKDRLVVSLNSDGADDASDSSDVRSLTIPWQKPPSKRSRQILLPHKASRSDIRPEQFERRARLVSTIARGRQWLDDVVSGRVTAVVELCTREKCSVRQVNMTMEPTVRNPRIESAIGSEAARSSHLSRRFSSAGWGSCPSEIQAAGNGSFGCRDRRPKITRETIIVGRD